MPNKTTTKKTAAEKKAANPPASIDSNGAIAGPHPADAAAKPTRATKPATAKKPAGKTASAPKTKKAHFTQDDIALRAYFIAEKRQTDGLHGDAHSDWLEAERQLLAESSRKSADGRL